MKNISVRLFSNNGLSKGTLDNIENEISFSENINGGQGSVNISLPYYSKAIKGDIIEISIYGEEYKLGKLFYSGVVQGVNFSLSKENGKKSEIEVDGIFSLLSDYSISKTYSGELKNVIDQFIIDFSQNFSLSGQLHYLGNEIFKNTITSTKYINVSVNETFFEALEKIFGEDQFYINKYGEIKLVSEITKKHNLSMNTEILEISVNKDNESEIEIIQDFSDIEPGEKFRTQNIPEELYFDNETIVKTKHYFDSIIINSGELISLGKTLRNL